MLKIFALYWKQTRLYRDNKIIANTADLLPKNDLKMVHIINTKLSN